MRPSPPVRSLLKTPPFETTRVTPRSPSPFQHSRACSRNVPLALSVTSSLNASSPHHRGSTKRKDAKEDTITAPVDHRAIGTAQSLFTTHPSSPGAPFFQPDGTHIFQKLVSFLRAQYPHFGFREVLTPTIYKEALWEQSGHWTNYKDDMFTVIGNSSQKSTEKPFDSVHGRMQPKSSLDETKELEQYGLKPMNCPGHCLLYKSERRSYRDLPIRYAEFSPLHRNEISGALSGLTRVRRFHQDDGHIFCRPSQIEKEIDQSLAFMRMVHETMDLRDYCLVLSTRPEKGYIGTVDEWDRAEAQLEAALDKNFGDRWRTERGEGAFYGPKIDLILRDSDRKEHQTATIQLDFQLPKRFGLAYESPEPEMEARGEDWEGSQSRTGVGRATPVMIHRAVLGSVERFMALLLEHYKGQLPFWLNPNQVIILTVSDKEHITSYARNVRERLLNQQGDQLPKTLVPPYCAIDIDDNADTISQKIVRAKKKKYNIICVVGQRNVTGAKTGAGDTVDLDVSAQPDQSKTWAFIEEVKPGSSAPVQKDRGTGATFRGLPGVRLTVPQCEGLIRRLVENYC